MNNPDLLILLQFDLEDQAGLTLEDLEKYRAATPSWEDVAPKFNLGSKDVYQLPTFSFPVALLPPSFHRQVMKASVKWLDVVGQFTVIDAIAVPGTGTGCGGSGGSGGVETLADDAELRALTARIAARWSIGVRSGRIPSALNLPLRLPTVSQDSKSRRIVIESG
jgi:hypothetical protein